MHWPRGEFWRLWSAALAVALLAVAVFLRGPVAARGETLKTSFYGAESGRRTASGARFDPMGLTAAHRSLPFGTRLRVCLIRCAIVVVNDRGPAAWTGRALDLSRGAAQRIGLEPRGVAGVTVHRLN